MDVCTLARDDVESRVGVAAAYDVPVEDVIKHARGECACDTPQKPVEGTEIIEDKMLLRYLLMQPRYTMKQIADLLGVHTATVKSAIRRLDLLGEGEQVPPSRIPRVLWFTEAEEFFGEEPPRWALYNDEWYEQWAEEINDLGSE